MPYLKEGRNQKESEVKLERTLGRDWEDLRPALAKPHPVGQPKDQKGRRQAKTQMSHAPPGLPSLHADVMLDNLWFGEFQRGYSIEPCFERAARSLYK